MKVIPAPDTDTKDKTVILRIYVAESLRNSFKAACAKQGKNMSEVMGQLMSRYTQEVEEAEGKKN